MENSKHGITKHTLKALRGESPRERLLHRLHCVAMALNGASASEAARIYGDSPRAVAYWVTQFRQHGIEGLDEEPRSGRPSQLSDKQLNALQKFVIRFQSQSKPVTANMLSQFIKEKFGITLPYRQCWRLLKRLSSKS